MVREQLPWVFEHSVECGTIAEFAWCFWTDVSNWTLDSDVESVELDGPFAPGARGLTNSKTSGRIEWRIAEASSGKAVIEFPLDGAVGRCVWSFEPSPRGSRITQRWTLEGERAGDYAQSVAPSQEAGIPAGMDKLCAAIEECGRIRSTSTNSLV